MKMKTTVVNGKWSLWISKKRLEKKKELCKIAE